LTGRIRRAAAALCLALAAPGGAAALDLAFPGPARATAAAVEAFGSTRIALGPWAAGRLPQAIAEGRIERRAWRVEAPGLSTLALLDPLRDQIAAAGFAALFECEARACGGFDFRYAADLLPEPEMHVDLGDFRYLAARRGDERLVLMVSRSARAGFVQLTHVRPAAAPAAVLPPEGAAAPAGPGQGVPVTLSTAAAPPADPGGVIPALEAQGHAALDDLVFDSGATGLAAGDYASLAALAAWLAADPARRLVLVGHTDASGGLEGNIAISRRRAEAVRAALIAAHAIDPGRVTAEGVGPLAPRAPNATEPGRRANRRVEAVAAMP
jgi:OOP family OmpA-OmpF porin